MSVPSEPSGHKPEEEQRAVVTLNGHEHTHIERKQGENPLTKDLEAQRTGVGGPLDISGGLNTDHLLTYGWDP